MHQAVFTSCREIYRHEPRNPEEVIVVEGLLTDKPGPHLIKLTGTGLIWEGEAAENLSGLNAIGPTYIRGASITVSDDTGNRFEFSEESPGHYYSTPDLIAVEGRSYRLHIITANGHDYESAEQNLPGRVSLDTILARKTEKERLMQSHQGTYSVRMIPGLDVIADISGTGIEKPLFRLVTQDLLLYTQTFANHQNFLWKKLYMPDNININMETFGQGSATVKDHEVTFMSMRKEDLHIDWEDDFRPHRRVLLFRMYSLNEESWNFYSAIHEQIHSEGRLFDPMAKQLPSNIYSLSGKGKLALGHFEVSRVTRKSWVVVETPWQEFYPLRETDDLHHIPDFGKTFIEPPDFWVD